MEVKINERVNKDWEFKRNGRMKKKKKKFNFLLEV